MPIECCQMLSIVASKWYHNYGSLFKKDDTPYQTEKGAFRNHPCTQWASKTIDNASWLIQHGLALCDEYSLRYDKTHGCYNTLIGAYYLFPKGNLENVTPFVRAMPDYLKNDKSIDTFEAYRRYIATKTWAKDNYLRLASRKPDWIT